MFIDIEAEGALLNLLVRPRGAVICKIAKYISLPGLVDDGDLDFPKGSRAPPILPETVLPICSPSAPMAQI